MTTGQDKPKRWSSWTIEIKVWKVAELPLTLLATPIAARNPPFVRRSGRVASGSSITRNYQ